MKKALFLILFSSSLMAASEWKAGEKTFALDKVGDDGHVSPSCLKECELKKMAKTHLSKLDEVDVRGGKDPASGYCKLLGGHVVYLTQTKNEEEAFCFKNSDIMSLSLLIP